MNKLEEYRNRKSLESFILARELNFQAGFDAAIALDLPVKFHMWTETVDYNKWLFLQSVHDETLLCKLAYKYWIDNIYKPE